MLFREERGARLRFEASMRKERTQVRTILHELSTQFKVMAGQIEQITVFLGTTQSMHTLRPAHPDDLLPTDLHTSTSRGIGTSPDPPPSDPHLSIAVDPTLESSTTHVTTQ